MTLRLYPPLLAVLIAHVVPGQVAAQAHHDEHGHGHHEIEEIIVQSTRSRRRVQDEPIRVEVINQEEIAEKLLMRPGNISMLLAETGGLRVQVTSPALGSANIRVHGMRGRYTQLLADGLPLYGGQASSLGLLQVPPSDLAQVEIIKGSASALYGGQALGGVINLLSRRPDDEAGGEVILNATTRNGQDASAYGSMPFGGGWSGSLLGSVNRQSEQDLDDDGWIDMPGYERASLRPRLYWRGDDGDSLYMTMGAMSEDRQGGTLAGQVTPDGQPFAQNQDTRRIDGGLLYERTVGDGALAQVRASGVSQSHDHRFGELLEACLLQTLLTELSLSGEAMDAQWLGGLAYQAERYDSDPFPAFDYSFEVPALFAQVDKDLGEQLVIAASARWDQHSDYGDQFSPRLSLLYRPGALSVRASWGEGFYAPTPFVEETEAAGLSRLAPLAGLRAETARTSSLDLIYAEGSLETGVTLFASDIDDAIRLRTIAPNQVQMFNTDSSIRTRGAEALVRWRRAPYHFTASYLYVDANEQDEGGSGRRDVPLTPRHSAGMVAMWEDHDRGRIGLELYYTGKQPLEGNAFRNQGDSYFQLGLLGEIVLGRYRLFLNLENLLNVRQTREDSLLRPARAADGRWTVDAWAPLDGFIANAGVRIRLGK